VKHRFVEARTEANLSPAADGKTLSKKQAIEFLEAWLAAFQARVDTIQRRHADLGSKSDPDAARPPRLAIEFSLRSLLVSFDGWLEEVFQSEADCLF
jgi:hypothetical protein